MRVLADGDVRYVIGKSVRKEPRVAAQAAFVTSTTGFWTYTGTTYRPNPQPFRMLHERHADRIRVAGELAGGRRKLRRPDL